MRTLFQVHEEWDLFNEYFDKVVVVQNLEECTPTKSDVVVFWGGPDLNPVYYHDEAVSYTHWENDRDALDWGSLTRAVDYGAGVFGICRGMQIMSPFCGGTLIQDAPGHQGNHQITVYRDRIGWTGPIQMYVNSVHHQMVRPHHGEQEVVGWAIPPAGRNYVVGPKTYPVTHISTEPEIVLYPAINGLGVQYHPEYPDAPDECVALAKHLFKRYLMEKKW